MTNFKLKRTSSLLIMAGTICVLSACSSTKSPDANYRVEDKYKPSIEKDIDKQIIEAQSRISSQLSLLNDSRISPDGVIAINKVPSNQNITEITQRDITSIIKLGESKKTRPDFYRTNDDSTVNPVIDRNSFNELYRPILARQNYQNENIALNARPVSLNNEPKTTTMTKIDLSKSNQEKQISKSTNKLGINRIVRIDGNYNSTELIRKMAEGAGYSFEVKGSDKSVVLNMSGQNKYQGSIKNVLIQAANQLDKQALVIVNNNDKKITLEYK